MKLTLFNLVSKLPSILCVAAAGILAYKELDGWGWFLFASIMLTSSVSVDDK